MTSKQIIGASRFLLLAGVVVLSFGAAGEICGPLFETTAAAFGSAFPDNKPEDVKLINKMMSEAAMRDGRPRNSLGQPIALLVIEESPRALIAMNLESGEQMWKISPPISSAITVGSSVAVFLSGNNIIAVGLSDGQKRWQYEIEEGWHYHGAAVNDEWTALSVGVGGDEAGGYANGRLVGVSTKNGVISFELTTGGGLVGQPELVGDLVFAPWGRQRLVVIDMEEGEEIGRLRAGDYTINYLTRGPGAVYFGSNPTGNSLATLYRLDEAAATGKREGSTVFVPNLEPVPGDPGFETDAFALPVAGRSAAEKIRFHWRPAASAPGTIAMANKQYYLHYWRYVIAFDSTAHQVVWSYNSDVDIESVRVINGGVYTVDSKGRISFVDAASGKETWSKETGLDVLTASFDAEGYVPASGGGAPEDPAIGLREMIRDKDNRMLPIRAYSAFLMAAMPAPEITRDLLQIYSDASTPKGLREAVVRALEKRKSGAQYLVDSLAMRYDYLVQTQPPPMGVVSSALVNMEERAAVPGLLQHLMDHETPVGYIRPISMAIKELGDPTVTSTLRQFLTLYHADSSFMDHEDALAGAAEALLKFEDKATAEPFIVGIRDGSQTLPELKRMLSEILDPEEAARAEAEAKAQAKLEAQAKEAVEAADRAAEAAARQIPESLSREEINRTIVGHQQFLKPCIQAALGKTPTLQSVRLRFLITGMTGRASDVRVLPNNIPGLRECLEQALGTVEFSKFRNLRQMATYTIRVSGGPVQRPGFAPATGSGQRPPQEDDPDAFGSGGTTQPAPRPGLPQDQPGEPVDPDAF